MKQIKKTILMALTAMLVFCVCASVFVACDNGSKTTYTIKTVCDLAKGEITLDKEVYNENDDVIVTVTPKTGFEVKKFAIGSDDFTDELYAGNYTYTFKATGDTTIGVDWQINGIRDNKMWKLTSNAADIDESHGSITFSPYKPEYKAGEEVRLIVKRGSDYDLKSVLINGVEYVDEVIKNRFEYVFDMDGDKTINVTYEKIDWLTVKNLTDETFDDAIKQGTIIVDFWASWCPNCPIMEKVLKDGLKQVGGYRLYRVDTDKNPELEKRFGAFSLPLTVLFKDGVKKAEKQGAGKPGSMTEYFDLKDLQDFLAKA